MRSCSTKIVLDYPLHLQVYLALVLEEPSNKFYIREFYIEMILFSQECQVGRVVDIILGLLFLNESNSFSSRSFSYICCFVHFTCSFQLPSLVPLELFHKKQTGLLLTLHTH